MTPVEAAKFEGSEYTPAPTMVPTTRVASAMTGSVRFPLPFEVSAAAGGLVTDEDMTFDFLPRF